MEFLTSDKNSMIDMINGHRVEFEPIEHIYYVDGIEVKSVSEICKLEHPSMYTGIDKGILKRAATRGTNLHKEIENFELYGSMSYSPEFKKIICK